MDRHSRRDARHAVVVLTLVWAAMIVVVDPRGNFPLADDWHYGGAVRTLLTDHRYAPSAYTEAALVAQALYGAIVCSVFGFSYTVLRLSTLFMGLCGGISLYLLSRAAGARHGLALGAALLLITNGLYFALSSTFMTDVPFFAWSTAGAAAMAIGLRSSRRWMFAAGIVLIVLATLTRQVGLVFAVACGAGYLVSRRLTVRSAWVGVLPAAAAAASLAAYSWYLRVGAPPTLFAARAHQTLALIWSADLGRRAAMGLIATFLYVGLAMAPFALVVALVRRSETNARTSLTQWAVRGGAAAAMLFALWQRHKLLPVTGDFLTVSGIGGLTLDGADALPQLTAAARAALTAVAVAGGLWTVTRIFAEARLVVGSRLRSTDGRVSALLGARVICLAAIAVYVPLVVPLWVYDRYLLPVIGMAFVAVAPAGASALPLRRPVVGAVAALVALQAVVTVAGTHDYLSWNRARWRAAADVQAMGYPPEALDAGREVNGWLSYKAREPLDSAMRTWSREHAVLRLTFACQPGDEVVREYPYATWLFPAGGVRALCLKRVPAAAPPVMVSPPQPADN